MNKLIGSSPTLEKCIQLISGFYMGSNISLTEVGPNRWLVNNSKGPINGVEVVLIRGRYRFQHA